MWIKHGPGVAAMRKHAMASFSQITSEMPWWTGKKEILVNKGLSEETNLSWKKWSWKTVWLLCHFYCRDFRREISALSMILAANGSVHSNGNSLSELWNGSVMLSSWGRKANCVQLLESPLLLLITAVRREEEFNNGNSLSPFSNAVYKQLKT